MDSQPNQISSKNKHEHIFSWPPTFCYTSVHFTGTMIWKAIFVSFRNNASFLYQP